jgi:VWFA-related protein
MLMHTELPSGGAFSRRDLLLSLGSLFPAARILRGQAQPTFSADVKVVNVLATVRNKKGEIAHNLTKESFQLEEDGRPQTIRYFAQESDLPLTLGLLVDTSLSQLRVLGDERRASYRFFDQVLREDKDNAFVIHFDREVELLQDLTSSRKQLEAALSKLEAPERPQWGGRGGSGSGGGPGQRGGGRRVGGTVLYDAVLLASDELMKKQHGRKALVMLSDGVDTGSKVPIAECIESAQRADTLVYSILFADEERQDNRGFGQRPGMGRRGGGMGRGGPMPQNRPDGKKILQRISRETGGSFFHVTKKLTIEQVYSRLQDELRHQYSLGYASDRANAGAGYRKISLTTKDKDLVVQARDGYYAEK